MVRRCPLFCRAKVFVYTLVADCIKLTCEEIPTKIRSDYVRAGKIIRFYRLHNKTTVSDSNVPQRLRFFW